MTARRRVNPDDAARRGDLMPGDGGPEFITLRGCRGTVVHLTEDGGFVTHDFGDDGVSADADSASTEELEAAEAIIDRTGWPRSGTCVQGDDEGDGEAAAR